MARSHAALTMHIIGITIAIRSDIAIVIEINIITTARRILFRAFFGLFCGLISQERNRKIKKGHHHGHQLAEICRLRPPGCSRGPSSPRGQPDRFIYKI